MIFEHHFPLLVAKENFPNTGSMNADLLNLILEEESNGLANDDNRATIGGYQPTWPGFGFLDQDIECVNKLQDEIIFPSVQEYARAHIELLNSPVTGNKKTGVTPPYFSTLIRSWTVLYRAGNFQSVHLHKTANFTGIYYAAVPNNLIEPKGALVFQNPMTESTWCGYYPTKHFMPQAGDLVIFPGWYQHQAYPFDSSGYRLSIVFDVTIK
jgi:hypothetical protein